MASFSFLAIVLGESFGYPHHNLRVYLGNLVYLAYLLVDGALMLLYFTTEQRGTLASNFHAIWSILQIVWFLGF